MRVLASGCVSSNGRAVTAEMTLPATTEEAAMREKLCAVRDTLIVLGIQIVFRTIMLLRSWNM